MSATSLSLKVKKVNISTVFIKKILKLKIVENAGESSDETIALKFNFGCYLRYGMRFQIVGLDL